MNLLLNDKEISNFLISLLDNYDAVKDIELFEPETVAAINYILFEQTKRKYDINKMRTKFKDKIAKGVRKDLGDYVRRVEQVLENRKKFTLKAVNSKLDYFLEKLDEEFILQKYRSSKVDNFVKSCGLHLDPNATLLRRKTYTNFQEECLLRNTVGNEDLLLYKIKNNSPFWFIDSGYTNFLEPNKKWHRLVKNHLHQGKLIDAPVDRLGIFPSFPQQWREGGDRILVIEPGPFAASIFEVNMKTWRYEIEKELRQYTDKKIIFREKVPKKTRPKLYEHLCDEDYYCVININSNAATEAIWAGVPVITLDKHISTPVAATSLHDINNLIKPNLANWLCTLSYSQFTYDEIINGTAAKLVRKYHD